MLPISRNHFISSFKNLIICYLIFLYLYVGSDLFEFIARIPKDSTGKPQKWSCVCSINIRWLYYVLTNAMLTGNDFFPDTILVLYLVAVAILKPHGIVGICFCNKTIINANSVAAVSQLNLFVTLKF